METPKRQRGSEKLRKSTWMSDIGLNTFSASTTGDIQWAELYIIVMDNCDLEKLSVSVGKLQPSFRAEVTEYKLTVESHVSKVTLDLLTSDCGASYTIVSLSS